MTKDTWSGPSWHVEVAGEVTGTYRTEGFRHPVSDVQVVERWWWFWPRLLGPDNQTLAKLKRADTEAVSELEAALRLEIVRPRIAAALAWAADVDEVLSRGLEERRWVTREQRDALASERPRRGLRGELLEADLLAEQPTEVRAAVALLEEDLAARCESINEQITDIESRELARFFASIEKSPLTEEQRRAVICMDNRVQLLAAAGSGKTSVMVARAAYTIARGFVKPEQILLLAFNSAAAKELGERLTSRLEVAGLPHAGVTASTFHKLGLRIIGQATGRKPRVAPWLGNGQDEERKALELVDELRDADVRFRWNWDLFRTLYGPADEDLAGGEPDRWDRQSKEPAFATFAGHTVRSEGERMIANWLYLSGVSYDYEAPYPVDTRDATHSQYHPDFHYPAIDAWHEHWGLDRDGNPPPGFDGYLDSITWKRQLHAEHGTTLIETTWADIMFENGLEALGEELESLGLELDWNPDRPPADRWAAPIDHAGLVKTVRTFMSHVKANALTRDDTYERARQAPGGMSVRTRLFLDLYWRFHDRWQEELEAHRAVDFDDMLGAAADHLETGFDPGYQLVLVDEFQDTSRVRARMAAALVDRPGRHLLAVGDDWQSINRFAGSDVAVMTEFESIFGEGPQLALTATFRCPQIICDVASGFVSKNPRQLSKPMTAADGRQGEPVRMIRTDEEHTALQQVLTDISKSVPPDTSATVDVLVRYWFQADESAVRSAIRSAPRNLRVGVRTVHASKGLEADYIVVLGVNGGTYGFPSGIEDDPVLDLAMPDPDPFEHAEERRLFYVALTRAREQAIVLTDGVSPFAVELLQDDPDPRHIAPVGFTRPIRSCPACGQGLLQEKRSERGPFLGCTRFPACGHTEPVRPPDAEDCPAPDCSGWLEKRKGKRGPFWGCSNYRITGCDETVDIVADDAGACPSGCGGKLVERSGPYGPFLGCTNWRPNNRGCDYSRSV